jgi:hypothetical protein
MARKTPGRMARAIADVMWTRDQMQMRAVDALLSRVDPKPGRQTRLKPRRAAKKRS